MFKAFVISRKTVMLLIGAFIVMIAAGILFAKVRAEPVDAEPHTTRTIHLVTGEFASKTEDGKVLEAYRWDPGTIFVEKGETVKLNILGINGASHPFIIEGTTIHGEVKKGQETVVTFNADKEGVYRIICLAHPDSKHNGPMIGYIVVD